MKKISKTALLILLLLMFVVSRFTTFAAASSEAVITVERVTADSGSIAEVTISVANNPGIAGMTPDVSFDSSVLTLVGVRDGGVLGVNTHKPELTAPYTLSWLNDAATVNIIENGVVATLRFLVNENASESNAFSHTWRYPT